MASLTLPNPGEAIIAFSKAMAHAGTRYAEMRNCKSCDKEIAAQWKRDRDLFAHLIIQIKEQTNA